MSRYSLRRTRDNAGDSGGLSYLIDKNMNPVGENNARPTVGYGIKVGSIYARTYQLQDHWCTTLVTEILEDTPEEVRFKTTNSEYIWKVI